MSRLQIRKDAAFDLEYFNLEGFTGTVDLTIYDQTSIWRASATLTPSAVTSTLTAIALRHIRVVTLADSTGFARGQQAVVVPASGVLFPIQILGVEGNDLHLENPLRVQLEIGDTIKLSEVESQLLTTETTTLKRDLRAQWTYTDGLGNLKSVSQYFDIVSDPWLPLVDEAALRREDSTVSEYMGGNIDLDDAVDGAKGEVESELRADNKRPDLYRFRDDLDRIVALFTLVRLNQAAKEWEPAKVYQEKGVKALAKIANSNAWYDIGDDLAKGDTDSSSEGDDLGALGTAGYYEEERSPIDYARVG